jgi:hypothetical protein
MWLLEIFVRGVIEVPLRRLKNLESLPAITDKRQLMLVRGRQDDKNYFRKQKTATSNYSDFELFSLVWGASCLPKDEYEKWIETMRGSFNKPLGGLFLKWATKNRSKLTSKLTSVIVDHPD